MITTNLSSTTIFFAKSEQCPRPHFFKIIPCRAPQPSVFGRTNSHPSAKLCQLAFIKHGTATRHRVIAGTVHNIAHQPAGKRSLLYSGIGSKAATGHRSAVVATQAIIADDRCYSGSVAYIHGITRARAIAPFHCTGSYPLPYRSKLLLCKRRRPLRHEFLTLTDSDRLKYLAGSRVAGHNAFAHYSCIRGQGIPFLVAGSIMAATLRTVRLEDGQHICLKTDTGGRAPAAFGQHIRRMCTRPCNNGYTAYHRGNFNERSSHDL